MDLSVWMDIGAKATSDGEEPASVTQGHARFATAS
jgi:hypothetical protein